MATHQPREVPLDAVPEKYVGKPIKRVEDRRILTGESEYVNDIAPDGTGHMAILRSRHAHAIIKRIDVDAAASHPECALVLTGADLVEDYSPMPCGIDTYEEWPLAVDRVRYVGEPVACVVAEDRYAAEDVLDRIRVEYERLPPVLDDMEARKDETIIHEDVGTNVADRDQFTFGDVDEAFRDADNVIERRFSWSRLVGLPLETAGVVSTYDSESNGFDIYSNQQMHTHPGRNSVAKCLNVPQGNVTLHAPDDIGGSFGTKITSVQRYCVLTAIASGKLDRPVKYIEDRVENLQGGDVHASDREFRMKLAVDDDGTIRGLDVWFTDDYGAYPRFSIFGVIKPLSAVSGPYDIENVSYEYEIVLTNKTSQTVYRGYGMPQHTYALELLIDEAARELQIDGDEFRRLNYIRPEQMPHQIASKNVYGSGDYPAALDQITEIIDENERREGGLLDPDIVAEKRTEGKYRGVKPSVFLEPGAGGQDWTGRMKTEWTGGERSLDEVEELPEDLSVSVTPDGGISVGLGTESAGQGHKTLVSQLVAEKLSIPMDRIEVRYLNSNEVEEMGAAASRMTVMLSGAATGVTEQLIDNLERLAAAVWECAREDVEYEAGVVRLSGTSKQLSLADLGEAAREHDGSLASARYVYEYPAQQFEEFEDAFRHRVPIFLTTAFAADAPIVEVDINTGAVEVLKYYSLHDCGTVVNPMMLNGQHQGAIAHGIGAALLQEFTFNESGQPQSVTLFDYLLPSITNIPEMKIYHTETPSPFTENGAKGAAEGGTISAPAAIAIAVHAALEPLGVTTDRIPITPDHVRSKLRE